MSDHEVTIARGLMEEALRGFPADAIRFRRLCDTARSCYGTREETIVALFHVLRRETPLPAEHLIPLGISADTARTAALLAKPPDESVRRYYERLRASEDMAAIRAMILILTAAQIGQGSSESVSNDLALLILTEALERMKAR